MPLKITEVARPTDSAATSRTASPAAVAQTPPTQIPTSTRAPSRTPMCGASAEATLAAASRTRSTQSTVRRSARRTATGSSGAQSAATRPGRVTARPVVPSEVSRPAPSGVRRPTGSISVVTTEKVAAATARTDNGRVAKERCMGPSLRRTAAGNNAEVLILV